MVIYYLTNIDRKSKTIIGEKEKIMKIKHYWDLLTGKIKVIKPASFFSFRNIRAVFQAQIRSIAGFKLKPHIYEQIIWRRTQVMSKSPQCWEQGHCRVCGCEILGKTMEDRACGISEEPELLAAGQEPCFPEMMTESQWNSYKVSHDIKLFE